MSGDRIGLDIKELATTTDRDLYRSVEVVADRNRNVSLGSKALAERIPGGGVGISKTHQLSLIARELIKETLMAIRSRANPGTVLHVLLLGQAMTVGEVAATLGRDPEDCESDLLALEQEGFVTRRIQDGVKRYSLFD